MNRAARELRIGTSGWVYKDWSGIFYPAGLAATKRLAYYAEHFDTVEINATHYRLASERGAAAWQATLPPDFHTVAKGSAFITHRLKLRDVGPALERFFAPLAPLTSLRVVLWQFPASFPRDLARVETFLGLLKRDVRHALEFRDAWWWSDPVRDLLAAHGAALCAVSHPDLPPDIVATGDLVYVRFHGVGPVKYDYHYSAAELALWAERIRPWCAHHDVYVFFNNDYHGHAIENARTLRDMLTLPRMRAPRRKAG